MRTAWMLGLYGRRRIHAILEVYHPVYIRAPLSRDPLFSLSCKRRNDSAREGSRDAACCKVGRIPCTVRKDRTLSGITPGELVSVENRSQPGHDWSRGLTPFRFRFIRE